MCVYDVDRAFPIECYINIIIIIIIIEYYHYAVAVTAAHALTQ